MGLLPLKQDQYVILEQSLGEMVYGPGCFSELSMSAIDSLFRSWLMHQCATLFQSLPLAVLSKINDKACISLNPPSHAAKEGLSPVPFENMHILTHPQSYKI